MTELLTILKVESNTLRIVVHKRDFPLTAMTARAVLLFQKISQLLYSRVLFLIEVLHTELTVNESRSTVDLSR